MPFDSFPGPIFVSPGFRPRPKLSYAVIDWDGTISLIRGGWVEMMIDVCLERAPTISRDLLRAEILALNGKPSIHQMTRVAELAGTGTAEEFQTRYVDLLASVVSQRTVALRRRGKVESLLVPGAMGLLEALTSHRLTLTVVSGTPLPEITGEASLLGVTKFFSGGLHGPRDTADREFSKRATIHSLLEEHGIDGEHFVAIGDGPIEIAEAKAMGGLAVAVVPDESNPDSRRFDDFKRQQLLECGADIVVPDFLDATALVEVMLGKTSAPVATRL